MHSAKQEAVSSKVEGEDQQQRLPSDFHTSVMVCVPTTLTAQRGRLFLIDQKVKVELGEKIHTPGALSCGDEESTSLKNNFWLGLTLAL